MRLVLRQEFELEPTDILCEVRELRKVVDRENDKRNLSKLDTILESKLATPELKLALKACREKGASSWVTAYPTYDHATALHKGEFTDSICIRYGWPLPKLPSVCKCGKPFSVQHALDCMLGGFRTLQHNETRDVVAQCMKDAGYEDVAIEPALQELSGENFKYKSANKDADARSDIKCCGFWSKQRHAYFDLVQSGALTFVQAS